MKAALRLALLVLLALAPRLEADVLHPMNDAAYDRGDAAFKRKDWAAAVDGYTEALKHAPYFEAYINRASAYVGLGKFDEAIADFDTAISLNNDAFFSNIHMRYIRYNRGFAYMGKKDFTKAIDDFSYIIANTLERSVPPFLNRGVCELQLNHLKEARHDFKIVLELSPRNLKANLLMLRLCQREGDAAATRQQLDSILALAEKSPSADLCNSAAWLLATSPDEKLRDGRRAVLYATKACELSQWKAPHPIDTLAAACAETGDFANAIKWEQNYLDRGDLTDAQRQAARAHLDLFQRSLPYREAD